MLCNNAVYSFVRKTKKPPQINTFAGFKKKEKNTVDVCGGDDNDEVDVKMMYKNLFKKGEEL